MRTTMVCLGLLCLCSLAAAQAPKHDAAIFGTSTPLILIDTKSSTPLVTSLIPTVPSLYVSRGLMFGPFDDIYVSDWTGNGIQAYDLALGAWDPAKQVTDSTNLLMGAPYQPCPDYENVGGFGLYCVDGNPPPTSLNPPANHRNTFRVSYAGTKPQVVADGLFPDTNVPMTDMYANLHGAGFIGVGFATNDFKVDLYPRNSTMTIFTPKTLVTLPQPSNFDATWGEDGLLYVFSYLAGNVPVMQKVDTQKGTSSTVAITGLPVGLYGALWADRWEEPGMAAYICSDVDDTIYQLDLLADPMVCTKILPMGTALAINTARNAEETQLCSWWIDTKGKRQFHVNFSRHASPGAASVLVPSTLGLARSPLVLNGNEIHLAIDPAVTIPALMGFLPYNNTVLLQTNGQGDHVWNGLGFILNVNAYWQAIAINQGKVEDVSNVINVRL
jgi:hypothetical protein